MAQAASRDSARALPALRAAVCADLARRGLDERKVLALVVRLLEATLIRVGNEAAKQVQNDGYGSAVLACSQIFFDTRLDRAVAIKIVRTSAGVRLAVMGMVPKTLALMTSRLPSRSMRLTVMSSRRSGP